MKQLRIDTTNRRIIIFTDSLSNFLPLIIKPPKRKKVTYQKLMTETRDKLKEYNIILWKIKSHTKPVTAYLNYEADILADFGRLDGANNTNLIAPLKYRHFTRTQTFPSGNNLFSQLERQHYLRSTTAGAHRVRPA